MGLDNKTLLLMEEMQHTNPYTAREQKVTTFMNTLAHKERVLTKGVK